MRPAIACTVVVGRVIVDGMSGTHTAAARLPDGSGQVPLTVFRPEGALRGGIVVLHESRVFPPALLAFMEVLAAEGWLVVAPNLFHREFTEDDEVFGQNLFDDVDAAMDWLVRSGVYPDAVGVIGFDDAGTAALIVAANRRVGAAVTVAAHGIVQPLRPDVPALVEAVRNLQAPWLGLYGEDDPTTPTGDVEQLREAAGQADAPTLVIGYPGLAHRPDEPPVEHDTADPDTDPAEAAIIDARRRIFDWFDAHLR